MNECSVSFSWFSQDPHSPSFIRFHPGVQYLLSQSETTGIKAQSCLRQALVIHRREGDLAPLQPVTSVSPRTYRAVLNITEICQNKDQRLLFISCRSRVLGIPQPAVHNTPV